jgi:hypothetical protein
LLPCRQNYNETTGFDYIKFTTKELFTKNTNITTKLIRK